MAQNVFRITPRASQVIRAIEEHLQILTDASSTESHAPSPRVKFNAGDLRFEDGCDGLTTVKVSDLEMAYVLPDRMRNSGMTLYHLAFDGEVTLRKHRVKKPGEKDFVYYTTEFVQLDQMGGPT